MHSYCIQEGSTLHLVLRLRGCPNRDITIYIIYNNGEKLDINLRSIKCPTCSGNQEKTNTLHLKKKIKEKLGIDIKNQLIIKNGKILLDSESLESNGIDDGAELELKIV